MKDFILAWRNLWRNKRRTLITAASVFFAVFFALVMRSFQLGAYDRLFRNVIESYTGYLQIQNREYFDEPILDNSFVFDTLAMERLMQDENVSAIVPRLESFALAAAGSRTQGVIVMGIDPEGEDRVTGIRNRLVKFKLTPAVIKNLKHDNIPSRTKELLDVFINESYSSTGRLMLDMGIHDEDSAAVLPVFRRHASFKNEYLNNADLNSVVLGNGLAGYLKANIGDTLVIMGQGYHGTTAAGKYRINGIVKLPAPEIDNRIVYMPVQAAGELFAAPGMITSAVIRLHNNDNDNVLQTANNLSGIIPEPLVTRSWHELNALLINQMEADNKSGAIMIGILYLVIAFGVFGTVLMMLAERRREFGMLISVGMQKRKLAKVFTLEMLMTGFLGIISGIIASLPVVIYGNVHPIRFRGELARMYEDYGFEPVMPTLMPDAYYLWQVVVILLILAITIAYSIRKIYKLNAINALKA
jgi:ABC-type lipoprotein release transport system permease subunit